MALSLDQKKAIVAEIAEIAKNSIAVVAAEYRSVSTGELTKLRAEARKQSVHVQVTKNTLAKRAFVGTDFECMNEGLTGPLILAFSKEDPGSAARVIRDFIKENKAMVPKLVAIGGKVSGGEQLETLAKTPTYDQAISMLMALMKAPVEKFVRTLNEPTSKLVRTVAAVKASKEA